MAAKVGHFPHVACGSHASASAVLQQPLHGAMLLAFWRLKNLGGGISLLPPPSSLNESLARKANHKTSTDACLRSASDLPYVIRLSLCTWQRPLLLQAHLYDRIEGRSAGKVNP